MKASAARPGSDQSELLAACWAIDRAMFDIMRTDASLQAVLSVLCRSVEQQAPGLICSILLLDKAGDRLLHGAAPSLPESFNQAVHGFAIGPCACSCGTAAYRRESVVVSDIARDPLWRDHRELALSHGLRACWSSPVLSRENHLLGTFAIYYREPRLPATREQHLVNWVTQIAAIAIERSRLDEALRRQGKELETVFDSAPVMIWFKDRENRILRANQPAAEAMGLPKQELEGRSIADFFPDDADRYHQDDLEVIRTGKPRLNIRGRLRTYAGETRRIITDKLPYRDPDGNILGVVVMARDVTEQMRAQSALRVAENRFRVLVEQLPTITYVAAHDQAAGWEYVSPQIENLLGFAPAEWLAQPGAWEHQLHPEDRGRVLAEEESSWATGSRFISEYRMLGRDGRVMWFRDEGVVMGDASWASRRRQGVMLDITGSRRIQDDLRETQRRLSTTVSNAPVVLFALDREGVFTLSEGRALQAMGLKPGEVVGHSFFEIYGHHAGAIASARRALAGEEFTSIGELPELNLFVETRWTPQRDYAGNMTGVIGVSNDITERKRAEMALQQSEANYRSMVERAPYGIYRADAEGRLLSVNPALVEMLGYESAEELTEANLNADIYSDPQEHVRLMLQNPDQFDRPEVAWKRKDGTPIAVSLRGRVVRDASGAILYFDSIVEEVTEKRKLEKQLRQAQKMEAVGRLVGGIAHDFNNLLVVIQGQMEMLAEQIRQDHPGQQGVEKAREAAERAASLTRQLLAFGRMQVLQPRVISLNAIIRGMDKLLKPLLGESIELVQKLDPGLAAVKADPGQMEQVILNLAVNARDAMPRGGRLTIQTTNAALDEAYARAHPPLPAGRYVMLAVHDSGIGMDKETQSHIFEPFFTTKEQGRGTGLGLATVYGIVKQSRGYIWVASEPDQGAAFQIYLPLVDEKVEAVKSSSPELLLTGNETILVAEDEEGVREVASQFLRKCGYTVLEARNGHEAIAIAESHPDAIHLLVTDMAMPGLSGRETAAQIMRLRPGIKVVCMSGYSEHSELMQAGDFFDLRLQKPFTRETMAQAVRNAIDGVVRPERED
jgi:PAS domain S-box-containing protein